ncbi:MAG: hypothetical protein KJI72_02500 [Patescibacteria group bacterium]|nr:hypothetical protein [Patescibacteria group bacterium]
MRYVGLIIVIIIVIVIIYNGVLWVSSNLSLSEIFYLPSGRTTSSTVGLKEKTTPKIKIEISPKTSEPVKPSITPPPGFSLSDLSPRYGEVDIRSVRRPSRIGQGGQFTLRAKTSLEESVNVTEWRIKSNDGEIILRGARSSFGPINITNIIIRPGTSAVVYGGTVSSIENIELNKCTGYLNNTYSPDPKLPNNCPRPSRSEVTAFSGDCQSFVLSLRSCEMPTTEDLNRFSGSDDVSCHVFLTRLNYQNCYNKYSRDSNFFSYGWRIWLDQILPFDSSHDRLLLLDRQGLLVDEHSY